LAQSVAPTSGLSAATVQGVVNRHIAAIGGEAALANLRDFRIALVYVEGTFSSKSSLAQARPYFRLVSVPAGPITKDSVLEGYDGAAWEYYGDPGVVLRTVGSAGEIARRNAHQFIDPLVDAADNATILGSISQRAVDGRPVFVISARYADGTLDDVFVDRATYLIDGFEQDIQFHAFGRNVTTHIDFDDYRAVGGVLMPFRSRQIENATGRIMDSSVVTAAQANVGLTPADFQPPAFIPTPLQAAIATIYAERDDPAAVLATYHDYRAVHGATGSSLQAMNFIGYQCLKMGNAKSAVALLAANVRDYPDAASAHFELGRALATDGKPTLARAEFDRALAIDPKYVRAADALRDLASSSR
jgi:tetratricopeptide (TPR) repeat protein